MRKISAPSLLREGARYPRRLASAIWFAIRYAGTGRWCPVCERSSRRFARFGVVPRRDARCAWCGALERHRLVWLFFRRMTDLFDGRPKRVLHVAPEACLEGRLKERLGGGYLTADLLDPRAMVTMDITDIQYPDESFDVIYCSHVLEHVPEDRRALREFCRVLKRGGWAVVLVPITAERTCEKGAAVDPSEREQLFGQEDHVRRYGPDYVERLCEAGFDVCIREVSDLCSEEEAVRMGLTAASGAIYCCRRAE